MQEYANKIVCDFAATRNTEFARPTYTYWKGDEEHTQVGTVWVMSTETNAQRDFNFRVHIDELVARYNSILTELKNAGSAETKRDELNRARERTNAGGQDDFRKTPMNKNKKHTHSVEYYQRKFNRKLEWLEYRRLNTATKSEFWGSYYAQHARFMDEIEKRQLLEKIDRYILKEHEKNQVAHTPRIPAGVDVGPINQALKESKSWNFFVTKSGDDFILAFN